MRILGKKKRKTTKELSEAKRRSGRESPDRPKVNEQGFQASVRDKC